MSSVQSKEERQAELIIKNTRAYAAFKRSMLLIQGLKSFFAKLADSFISSLELVNQIVLDFLLTVGFLMASMIKPYFLFCRFNLSSFH